LIFSVKTQQVEYTSTWFMHIHFMRFSLNALYKFTPLPKLRPLIFGLQLFGLCIFLFSLWECLFIHAQFCRNTTGV
jgi:hypothetical protein